MSYIRNPLLNAYNRLAEGNIDLPDFDIQVKASEALENLRKLMENMKRQLQEINSLPNRLLSQVFNEIGNE